MSADKINNILNQHDDLYQMLVDLHEGLSEAESNKLNAKLIITLMSLVGDREKIEGAIRLVAPKPDR